MSDSPADTGYHLEGVFAHELKYQSLLSPNDLPEEGEAELSWDWYAHDEQVFDVRLAVRMEGTRLRPEKYSVAIVGRFVRVGRPVRPAFVDFVRTNATALLMPFLRETVAGLTSRGPLGAFMMSPLNVIELAKAFTLEGGSGMKRMQENPALAENYGISLSEEPKVPTSSS